MRHISNSSLLTPATTTHFQQNAPGTQPMRHSGSGTSTGRK
ncbi:MAG: hypothetical protein ACRYFX_19045 [Janthinobacterium lividum]